ncbi:hypothetical protein [Apilactobacillus timberlakei]|uniref:hypothetical protein n=1 Tax=Apilactobacillus timberlakei TaxID=2008380 RepID=UPI00112B9ED0|nr:hypothetical protein [Apilactobacillus timberlakei]TPR16643.1 hypothetical protein DYZ95_07315 [Apilactobacillus timberlakei]
MPIQNAQQEVDNRLDPTLSTVSIDGYQLTEFQPGQEPWTDTPQGDSNTVTGDAFGSGIAAYKDSRAHQYTINTTAFEKFYQDKILPDVHAFMKAPHEFDGVNQFEHAHAKFAYLTRDPTIGSNLENANRTLVFSTVNGSTEPAPK